jgi:hypothetical protein
MKAHLPREGGVRPVLVLEPSSPDRTIHSTPLERMPRRRALTRVPQLATVLLSSLA